MTLRTVLLVDDEPDIRRIGEICLRQVGKLDVLLASSGLEAVEIATQLHPDVVLLDVMMPEMDGPSTLALLRAGPETKSIPVIFVTAKVQRHEVEHYRALGAVGVLAKPFDPMTLAADVRRMLGESAP